MRYIEVPEDIQIDTGSTQPGAPAKAAFPWTEYLKFLEADPRFLQNARNVFDAIDMRDALHASTTPGAVIPISDDHHRVVEEIALKPQLLPSTLAIQAGAYARAIQSAAKEKPKSVAEAGAPSPMATTKRKRAATEG